jgi:hypothetical protein
MVRDGPGAAMIPFDIINSNAVAIPIGADQAYFEICFGNLANTSFGARYHHSD